MNGRLMAQEMGQQPAALARFIERFDDHVAGVRSVLPRELAGVAFVARGSSDHAAIYGRYLAEIAARRPASLVAPSLHTLYAAPVDYSGWLVVALSQSGATPEITTVMERLSRQGARTVAVVNDAESPLAQAAQLVVALDAGPEVAVPATKTVTTELLAMAAVASALGPVPFARAELARLPDQVAEVLADERSADELAQRWAAAQRAFIVARGLLLAAALETALKVKETTGVLAEGMSAADLRHGPIAAVGPAVPVLVIDGGGNPADDLRELALLAAARGADVARCAPAGAELWLPEATPEALAVVTATARGQQLAAALARVHGVDADAPEGLAKVTATT